METTVDATDKEAVARTKAALAAFHAATDFQPPEVRGRFVRELLDHNGHPGAWEFVCGLLIRYMDLGQFRVAVERLEAAMGVATASTLPAPSPPVAVDPGWPMARAIELLATGATAAEVLRLRSMETAVTGEVDPIHIDDQWEFVAACRKAGERNLMVGSRALVRLASLAEKGVGL